MTPGASSHNLQPILLSISLQARDRALLAGAAEEDVRQLLPRLDAGGGGGVLCSRRRRRDVCRAGPGLLHVLQAERPRRHRECIQAVFKEQQRETQD